MRWQLFFGKHGRGDLTLANAVQEKIQISIVQLLDKMGIRNGSLGMVGAVPDLMDALLAAGYAPKELLPAANSTGFAHNEAYVAIIVPNLTSLIDPDHILTALRALSTHQQIPLVLATLNISHIDNTLGLLFGKALEGMATSGGACYTATRLEALMAEQGFAVLEQNDVQFETLAQYEPARDDDLFMQKDTLIRQYIARLKNRTDPYAQTYAFVRAYSAAAFAPVAAEATTDTAPFLSVLTRTQGLRPEELAETLLCLAGQSDDDFEVLVVGHKVRPEQKASILRVINETPGFLRERIRYLEVDTGNRSTPLNHGFANARGRYVSILDDDDLVMDNWVEAFKNAHKKGAGTVLHAFAVTQDWEKGTLPEALCATSKMDKIYCKSFDYVRQVVDNYCPTMSLAFPTAGWRQLRRHFDEGLNTTEDWDYLMDMAFTVGVTDTPKVTSIYRLWKNADSSATLHDQFHWLDNYNTIKSRLNNAPLLLPPGSARTLDEYYRISKDHAQQNGSQPEEPPLCKPLDDAVLYVSRGHGFSEDEICEADNQRTFPAFAYEYTFGTRHAPIDHLRFDPTILGELAVVDLEITLTTADGADCPVSPENIGHNGHIIGPFLLFLRDDPQIIVKIPEGINMVSASFKGKLEKHIPREVRQQLWELLASPPASPTESQGLARRFIGKIRSRRGHRHG